MKSYDRGPEIWIKKETMHFPEFSKRYNIWDKGIKRLSLNFSGMSSPCRWEGERAARWDVGIISGLLQEDQVGQKNEGGSEGTHKAVRGRSSVKSLPPCCCDPPGRISGHAVMCMCL